MDHERIGYVPWHLRQATHSHYRHFDHLMELHRLTEAWVRELQASRPSHSLDRGLHPHITENLWMLENPTQRGLDALLDDTTPDDVLNRLERTIWAVQTYTLGQLLERTKENERAVLDAVLEQISWKLGRECAERNWQGLPDRNRMDLRRMLLAFINTPFGSNANGPSFLVLRATEQEASVELHDCPHQKRRHFNEIAPIADELCKLHGHWARGYAYGLNHRLQVKILHETGSGADSKAILPRCGQRWTFTNAV